MKKIFLIIASAISLTIFSFSANALKVGALYLDTAGFFGEIKYNPFNFLTTKYNFATNNNFSDINYENLISIKMVIERLHTLNLWFNLF